MLWTLQPEQKEPIIQLSITNILQHTPKSYVNGFVNVLCEHNITTDNP